MWDQRGQLYTIEGVIGALVIISAVVFAMQAVVLTPESGGGVSPESRADLRHQANDVLSIAAQNDTFDLNRLARYWSQGARTFYGGVNPRLGYGERGPPGVLGQLLNQTFEHRTRSYNLELRYRLANDTGTTGTVPVVYTGQPDPDAVVVSRTVALFDNQTLTAPRTSGVELWQYDTDPTDSDDGYYPIPDAIDGPLYNVVEVRLTVW
ncbi:MAG: hypothetical protein ABEH64_11105 [Salinirussus sp.]